MATYDHFICGWQNGKTITSPLNTYLDQTFLRLDDPKTVNVVRRLQDTFILITSTSNKIVLLLK